MKSIRKYLKTVSFVFSFLILFVSCSQYDGSNNSDLNSKEISGEELFKGVFFGNGTIASKLANYKDYENLKTQFTSEQKTAFIKLQNDLITYINNNSPEYFVSFKNAINTGNQIIIRQPLELIL
ncbi:MAG: hypothetical protein L3J20_08405 [Flavobacteriaceae bacterium]|nr:hypothetical protein [Flavobacteriaceae bacterium]